MRIEKLINLSANLVEIDTFVQIENYPIAFHFFVILIVFQCSLHYDYNIILTTAANTSCAFFSNYFEAIFAVPVYRK